MNPIPSPLASAFAALAAELRARAGDGTGQGAQAAFHALILLGLIRVLWVLESMVRHWHSVRPAAATGHTLLAAHYPREKRPRRPLTPRIRADLRALARPYQAPATITPPVSHACPRRQTPARPFRAADPPHAPPTAQHVFKTGLTARPEPRPIYSTIGMFRLTQPAPPE